MDVLVLLLSLFANSFNALAGLRSVHGLTSDVSQLESELVRNKITMMGVL